MRRSLYLFLVICDSAIAQISPDAKALVERAVETHRSVIGYQLEYKSTSDVRSPGMHTTIDTTGSVAAGTGGKLRIEVKGGAAPFLLVFDGQTAWHYLPRTNIYSRLAVKDRESLAAFADVTSIDRLDQDVKSARTLPDETVVVDGQSTVCNVIEIQAVVLGLVKETTIRLWIDKTRHIVLQRRMIGAAQNPRAGVPQETRVDSTVTSLKWNIAIPDEMFVFRPPPGTAEQGAPRPAPPPQSHPGEQSPSGAYHIGGGVSAPTVLQKKEPEYTSEARLARMEGTVVLGIVVDENGQTRDVRVMRSLGLGLDEKAIEAVTAWRFNPGLKAGKPVPIIAQVEMNFRLLNGASDWHLQRVVFDPPGGTSRPVVDSAQYPPSAGNNESGAVTLSFVVDQHGVPTGIHVDKSSDPKWESEASWFVSNWRFRPSMRDGEALPAVCTLELIHGEATPAPRPAPAK